MLDGGDTESVVVAVEENTLTLALGISRGLNPLAPAGRLPHALDKAERSTLGVGAVVAAHDRLDGLGSLVGVVEGDGADVVVEDVGLDNAVEKLAANEAELTVNRCGRTSDVVPGSTGVVRKGGVGVLEVGDSN